MNRLHTNWLRILVAVAVSGLVALLLGPYRLGVVMGNSMEPGLHTGDLLVVNRRAYQRSEPERGDVVLARYRQEYIVKRVVGLPGERVSVTKGELYVNGAKWPEAYASEYGPLEISPGTLRRGKYALLGDNRSVGLGTVVHVILPKDQIVGKIVRSVSVLHHFRRGGDKVEDRASRHLPRFPM